MAIISYFEKNRQKTPKIGGVFLAFSPYLRLKNVQTPVLKHRIIVNLKKSKLPANLTTIALTLR